MTKMLKNILNYLVQVYHFYIRKRRIEMETEHPQVYHQKSKMLSYQKKKKHKKQKMMQIKETFIP